jgi:hypothetical protein
MGLTFFHLGDPDVREAMVLSWSEEWADIADAHAGARPYGKDLTQAGGEAFSNFMPEALAAHDDDWLSSHMDRVEYWRPSRERRTKTGFTTQVVNRAEAIRQLCIGEFNIAYIRGLARALVARGETEAVIYRAGAATEARAECTSWEGQRVSLGQVLDGHRARYWPPPGDRRAWSLPTGVNCHHSIHALDVTAATT